MSLSDCPRCWDTPCSCGEHWKDSSDDTLYQYVISVFTYIKKDRAICILERVILFIKARKE